MLFAEMGTDCDRHSEPSPAFHLYCSKIHDLPVSVVSGSKRGQGKEALIWQNLDTFSMQGPRRLRRLRVSVQIGGRSNPSNSRRLSK